MKPLKLVLSAQYEGDTWPGFQVNSLLFDGNPPYSRLASCKMQFRSETKKLGFELSSQQESCKGAIMIDDPGNWGISISPVILPLKEGMWWWDLEMTSVDGIVFTILKGRLRIINDVTKR